MVPTGFVLYSQIAETPQFSSASQLSVYFYDLDLATLNTPDNLTNGTQGATLRAGVSPVTVTVTLSDSNTALSPQLASRHD